MFDLISLRTFAAVARLGSFTRAAKAVHLTQAAVSQQIKKLEEQTGRSLFARTTHSVALTTDGEVLLRYAQVILKITEDATRHFSRRQLTKTIRLGVAEDYALSCLPRALLLFQQAHPRVHLHVELGLSIDLFQRLDDGEFDVVLGKTLSVRSQALLVLREPLVWVCGRTPPAFSPSTPVPLALYPPPGVSRGLMLDALERAGREWSEVYSSPSIAALRAAVLSGLAVSAFPRRLIPPGLQPLPPELSLPALGELSFFLDWHHGEYDPAIDLLGRFLNEAANATPADAP